MLRTMSVRFVDDAEGRISVASKLLLCFGRSDLPAVAEARSEGEGGACMVSCREVATNQITGTDATDDLAPHKDLQALGVFFGRFRPRSARFCLAEKCLCSASSGDA